MNLDFNDIININIDGWKDISIQYKIITISTISYLYWNVIGTEHIFKVELKIVTFNHGGNYKEHFIKTLTKFRTDLINWYYNADYSIDMSKYNDFKDLII